MERKHRGSWLWIRHALVFPLVVVSATAAVELVGMTGLVALAPCAAVWVWTLVRGFWRDRALVVPKLAFLVLTVLAIVLLRPAAPGRVPEDLAEVLLRELLETRPRNWTYYVEVDGKDASPELLRRLADFGVRMKPRSMAVLVLYSDDEDEAEYENRIRNNVKDRDTGEYGTLLRIHNLSREWPFIFSLTVDSGSHTGALRGHGKRRLVMHLGRWRITGATMVWVS